MHVLEVIHGLAPGGAESAMIRRLRHQPSDVRTTVLSATPIPDPSRAALLRSGVAATEHRLGWRDAGWLRAFVETSGVDVVVSHAPRETIKLLAWQTTSRVPLVVVAHHELVSDDASLRHVKAAALRVLNPRAQLHIAVSPAAARGAQCRGARNISVHLLGAEVGEAGAPPPAWPPGTRVRLVTLSRLIAFKNLVSLVEAVGLVAPRMRGEHAHLAIVGSGPLRPDIARAIQRRAVGDIVTLHDYIPDPASLLAATDVLVNAATSEGGPLTLFEASLAGARILSTPTGVAADVLADDPGSVLLAGSSPTDLAAGLVRVLDLGAVTEAERAQRRATAAQWESAVRAPLFYEPIRALLGAAPLPRADGSPLP